MIRNDKGTIKTSHVVFLVSLPEANLRDRLQNKQTRRLETTNIVNDKIITYLEDNMSRESKKTRPLN